MPPQLHTIFCQALRFFWSAHPNRANPAQGVSHAARRRFTVFFGEYRLRNSREKSLVCRLIVNGFSSAIAHNPKSLVYSGKHIRRRNQGVIRGLFHRAIAFDPSFAKCSQSGVCPLT